MIPPLHHVFDLLLRVETMTHVYKSLILIRWKMGLIIRVEGVFTILGLPSCGRARMG
jgi:hypothetical protein